MNKKWQKTAGDLLLRAADTMGNAGCNDWPWPAGWTPEERLALTMAMVADNVRASRPVVNDEDLEEAQAMARGEYGPPDWWVAMFLGKQLGGSERP